VYSRNARHAFRNGTSVHTEKYYHVKECESTRSNVTTGNIHMQLKRPKSSNTIAIPQRAGFCYQRCPRDNSYALSPIALFHVTNQFPFRAFSSVSPSSLDHSQPPATRAVARERFITTLFRHIDRQPRQRHHPPPLFPFPKHHSSSTSL